MSEEVEKKAKPICIHKYLLGDTFQTKRKGNRYTHMYCRISFYYCTKCLKEVEKIKEVESASAPSWFK